MDAISRYIVSCDTVGYGRRYQDLLRYINGYHTESAQNTRQNNFNENLPSCCGLLLVFCSLSIFPFCHVSRLAIFVVLPLSVSWTHHKTDRTSSKRQTYPLTTRPAACARVSCVSLFIFLLVTWYSYYSSYEVPRMSLVLM